MKRSGSMAAAIKAKVRVNVLFEPEEFARLADYCEREGYKKSTLIARVVREYLDGRLPKTAGRGAKTASRAVRRGKPPAPPARARR